MKPPPPKLLATVALSTVALAAQAQDYYLDKIEFTLVPRLLTNWNTDFGTDGGTTYFRGYLGVDLANPDFANPVLAIQGRKLNLSVGSYLKPSLGSSYTLTGNVGTASFNVVGIPAASVPADYSFTSTNALPVKIDVIPNYISRWDFVTNGNVRYQWNPSAGVNNTAYILWGTPLGTTAGTGFLGTPTLKRVDWATNLTKGLTSTRAIADGVWTRLANGTNPASV